MPISDVILCRKLINQAYYYYQLLQIHRIKLIAQVTHFSAMKKKNSLTFFHAINLNDKSTIRVIKKNITLVIIVFFAIVTN